MISYDNIIFVINIMGGVRRAYHYSPKVSKKCRCSTTSTEDKPIEDKPTENKPTAKSKILTSKIYKYFLEKTQK